MNTDIRGNLLCFPVIFFFVILLRWWTRVLNMAKFQIITSVWPFYGHLTFSLSEITELIGKERELRVCFRLQTGQMLVSALHLAQNALFFFSTLLMFTCMQPNPVKHVWFIRLRQQTVTKKLLRPNIAHRYLQTHMQIQSVFTKIRGVKHDSPAVTPHKKGFTERLSC